MALTFTKSQNEAISFIAAADPFALPTFILGVRAAGKTALLDHLSQLYKSDILRQPKLSNRSLMREYMGRPTHGKMLLLDEVTLDLDIDICKTLKNMSRAGVKVVLSGTSVCPAMINALGGVVMLGIDRGENEAVPYFSYPEEGIQEA